MSEGARPGASSPREPRASCFSSGSLHEKTGHGVCARVRPYIIDKSSGCALSGGPAPFTSPPGVIGVWPSHAIASGDSFGAGCLTILQDQYKHPQSRPGAARLEVGPHESRAGSRVPRHTSSSPAVQATCQGGLYTPRGLSAVGSPPPTHQWKHHTPRWPSTLPRSGYARAQAEALCSALVINN